MDQRRWRYHDQSQLVDDLTEKFRIASPHWAWVRENFTMPSLLAMGSVVSGAAWYCISLSMQMQEIQYKEQRDVSQITQAVGDVKQIVQSLPESIAEIRRGQVDQGDRLTRLEGDYDVAYREAAKPIPRKRFK